jgi:hypothetical protein
MFELVAIPFGSAQGTLPLCSLNLAVSEVEREAEGKLKLHKAGSIIKALIAEWVMKTNPQLRWLLPLGTSVSGVPVRAE